MKCLIVVCAVLLWAGSANAGGIAGVIKGGLISDTSGACGVGYSSYCPSGECECAKFVGVVSGNQTGRGAVNLFMTVDRGAEVSPDGAPTCYPIFASAQISASRDHETLNFIGTTCTPASGVIAKITGGFGIESSEVGTLGWGGLGGSVNLSTGAAVVHFRGGGGRR